MLKLLAISIAALSMLGGCATQAVSVASAVPVPPEQVYQVASLPEAGNAKVTFVRDVGFYGGGVFIHLYIDGERVASLDPGQMVTLVVSPGEHSLGVKGTDPFGVHQINAVDLDAKPDRQYLYRLQLSERSGPMLRRLMRDEAE